MMLSLRAQHIWVPFNTEISYEQALALPDGTQFIVRSEQTSQLSYVIRMRPITDEYESFNGNIVHAPHPEDGLWGYYGDDDEVVRGKAIENPEGLTPNDKNIPGAGTGITYYRSSESLTKIIIGWDISAIT